MNENIFLHHCRHTYTRDNESTKVQNPPRNSYAVNSSYELCTYTSSLASQTLTRKRGSGDTAIVELCRMSPVLGGHVMITLRNLA